MASHASGGSRKQDKIAIPRLDRRNEPPRKAQSTRQTRVSRACLSCRSRKIKCNGVQPTCQHCAENATHCVYASSRKDRLKTATDHNQDMLQLLRDLRDSAADAEKTRIDNMLAGVTEDIADATTALRTYSSRTQIVEGEDTKMLDANDEGGEAMTSAEVGSNEDLDTMDEDLLRNDQSRATGYLGKHSSVQWFRKIHREADTAGQDGANEGPYGPPGKGASAIAARADALKERQSRSPYPLLHTSSCSFYLDDENVDMDFVVDPLELPPFETAERLLSCYMETVQTSYPIVAKKTFIAQFHLYYNSLARNAPYQLSRKWQAMLNLVFAIGAAYSHLVNAPWRANDRDHFLYHSRAWSLSLKDPWWFSHPDLPQTQITGLLALYYLTIGHVNRSWIVIGMAMRFGVGLGLHVRNDDRAASTVKKEILSRIWWGLYSLERILCAITGRPSVGTETYASVAYPLPISEEEVSQDHIMAKFGARPQDTRAHVFSPSDTSSASSSQGIEPRGDAGNSGSYLTCTIKLGMITQKALNTLYSPSIISDSWRDVQQRIVNLIEELETWAAQLPRDFGFSQASPRDGSMNMERNNLRIYYYSARILITRPCLCRIERRIINQTQGSSDFNHSMASNCVDAAKALTSLLPDDMSDRGISIYQIFPWWAAVHYIMQSLAVLMLEISYDATDNPERNAVTPTIKKLIRLLRVLGKNNGMARRAYAIAFELLQKMVIRIRIDISDLLHEQQNEDAEPAFVTQHPPDVFAPHAFTDQDFLEQYTLPAQDPYANLIHEDYRGTDSPLPDLFHESLQSNAPLAPLFLTGFDQQNPLPFGNAGWDTVMDPGPEREAQSVQSAGRRCDPKS